MSPVCCSDCHKPLDKIPLWLETVNVVFVCEDCRQKHRAPVKARAVMELDPIIGEDEVVIGTGVDEESEPTLSLEALAEKENRESDTDDEEVDVDDAEDDLEVILADDDSSGSEEI